MSVLSGTSSEAIQKLAIQDLENFKLAPEKEFKLVRNLDRQVKKHFSEAVFKQESPDGGTFAPRYRRGDDAGRREKKKLLIGIAKASNIKEYSKGSGLAVGSKKIGNISNTDFTLIAAQYYFAETRTSSAANLSKEEVKKRSGKSKDAPPTMKMAKELLAHGYRQPVKKKDGTIVLRRVSARDIITSMNFMQASLLLLLLVQCDVSKTSPRGSKKTSWQMHLPARSFFVAN